MGLFDYIKLKAAKQPVEEKQQANNSSKYPSSDVAERPGMEDGILKTYIPNFLYKPPYGYPRPINVPLIRQISKNGYVFAVKNLIKEEVASTSWKIVPRADDTNLDLRPDLIEKKKQIEDFLQNPNGNKEDWAHLVRAMVNDVLDLDSGVWVKVFNKQNKLVQLFARDGGSFLLNPDPFGYIGNRVDIIEPTSSMMIDNMDTTQQINYYDMNFKNNAAYFQYGWTVAALPVPFGKREIIYFMKNPQTDSIYGLSPVQILSDIIMSLVYGSKYNLDFYMNGNIPEGIISVLGAKPNEVKDFKERFESKYTTKDELTGFARKIGFKVPVTSYDAKFIPFIIPSKEMQIIEQQQWFTRIVWSCFGVSADDLGFSDQSNKSVSESYERRYARKVAKPLLNLIESRINKEIIPEFGTNELIMKFDFYDLDEDIKKHTLYETQIRMGIKTPEMVAAEEDIDISELRKSKAEKDASDMAKMEQQSKFQNNNQQPNQNNFIKSNYSLDNQKEDPFANTQLEKEMVSSIDKSVDKVKKAMKLMENGSIGNIS